MCPLMLVTPLTKQIRGHLVTLSLCTPQLTEGTLSVPLTVFPYVHNLVTVSLNVLWQTLNKLPLCISEALASAVLAQAFSGVLLL